MESCQLFTSTSLCLRSLWDPSWTSLPRVPSQSLSSAPNVVISDIAHADRGEEGEGEREAGDGTAALPAAAAKSRRPSPSLPAAAGPSPPSALSGRAYGTRCWLRTAQCPSSKSRVGKSVRRGGEREGGAGRKEGRKEKEEEEEEEEKTRPAIIQRNGTEMTLRT